MRSLYFFSILMSLIFCGHISMAAPNWRAEVISKTTAPSAELIDYWVENYFESDEFWMIKDKDDLLRELRYEGFDSSDDLYFDFKELISDSVSDEVLRSNAVIYKLSLPTKFFMVVPDYIRAQLPHHVLEIIYRYLIVNGVFLNHEVFATKEAAIAKYGKAIGEDLYSIKGRYYLFLNRAVWPKLPRTERERIVLESLQTKPTNIGLDIKLKFKKVEDVDSIAETFAAKTRIKAVKRYLKMRLRQNQGRMTMVKLSDILPAYARQKLDTYASCNGANCFNSTVNMMQRMHESRFTSDHELREKLDRLFWQAKEDLTTKPGDVVVFYDKSNGKTESEVHAATVIGSLEGSTLVFTKNGFDRFSPYIIQSLDMNSDIYSEYEFKIFHRKLNCSKAQ